jgi:hypothetical protein
MGTGRRLVVLLLALALIGVPAAVLRIACVGASCRSTAEAAASPAPFCSLPADVRALIEAGTYEQSSPDVIGVAASTPVVARVGGGMEVPWPSTDPGTLAAMRAPLSFIGSGIEPGRLPRGVTLDQVAPTLEPLLGLHRAHPDVRSGTEIDGVVRAGAETPLAVLIVWKGVGNMDLDTSWRRIMTGDRVISVPTAPTSSVHKFQVRASMHGIGAANGSATAGSLPLDPVAVETTIGTGGLPSDHGITGTRIMSDGNVVRAFGPGSPQPVIATLGDDLSKATAGNAKIGLIETDPGDEGLTGDDWYGGGVNSIVDREERVKAGAAVDITPFLDDGWGADDVPDVLAIALSGSFHQDDVTTVHLQQQVLHAVPDATLVIAGTGSLDAAHAVSAPAPVGTDAVGAGGLFVQPGAAQDVVDALHAITAPDGTPLLADAFASYAVQFGSYC